jgi:uncharacterized protein (DUF169 family)
MTNYAAIERQLTEALGLTRRPIAVAFSETAPTGVPQFTGSMPSGCSFWKLAAEGRTFYTEPADHLNCPIGSYTHNVPMPPAREQELMQTLGLMSDIGYIRMEEVPAIPRLAKTPGAITYAPLGETPVAPDAVLVSGPPGRLMLLQEAATRHGSPAEPLYGRPTCMAIPAVQSQAVASSLGCIGNRIYTELSENDLYVTIAGKEIEAVARQLATIVKANAALTDHHNGRKATLTSQQ